MIKINAITHTDLNGTNGIMLPSGTILDVNPHFLSNRVPEEENPVRVQHDIAFDVKIYKDLASYEAGNDPIVKAEMREYNIGFKALDVDIQSLTSVSDLLTLLKNHIENGDSIYSGVGQGNVEIVWPYSI